MKNLKNKVALVTGGNSGIGYATAAELIAQGATTIITGRRREAVEQAAVVLGAIPIKADQANLKDTDLLYQEIKSTFGKLDILFINAGITGNLSLIENTSPENFDQVMNINFRGAYFTLSKLIPLLNEGASVVILSSIVANTHKPYRSIYQASKAALSSIAKTAAAELAERKIRVNIISPGPHKTEVLKKSGLDDKALKAVEEQVISEIPLKKIGAAEDIAKLVAYLCDKNANFMTGTEIIVDGGMTL